MAAVDELHTHFAIQGRHQDDKHLLDLVLNFEGTHVRADSLSVVERTWISRVNASRKLQSLAMRKHLGIEDYEIIVAQLFLIELDDLLSPKLYEIMVTGLGVESIITSGEAKSLVGLGLSRDEFEQGARWTGARSHHQSGHDWSNSSAFVVFSIPKPVGCSLTMFSDRNARKDLHAHLHILVEAAVYDQNYWKGYYFANARLTLSSFYEAWQLETKGVPTLPHLTDYKRPWTYREIRLLRRGQLTCALFQSFDNGDLADFGIIRAIRGSSVGLPGQGY